PGMRDDRAVSPRQAWTTAILLWVTVSGLTAYEIAPASVLTLVARDLGVGSTAVSWLVSVFILGMAVLSIPAGLLLDRVDNREAILLTAVLLLGTTVWAALAGSRGMYWSLVAARLVGGGLNVILWTAAVNVVGTGFVRSRQGTGIGFLSTSVPGGFALSHLLTPVLTRSIGWGHSFVVYGVLSMLAAGVFFVYTGRFDLRTSVTTPTRAEFLAVLRNRWVWALGAMAFVAFSLNLFFNNWLPTYLVDQFGFSLAQGGAFAAVFPAIGAVARFLSGATSDRLLGGRRRPIVLASFVIVVPLIGFIAIVRGVALLVLALLVAGFVTQMGLALLLPFVRELVDENVAGTALAVLNLVGFVGAFVTPVLTGFLIEWTGAYHLAFGYAAGLGVVGVVLSWLVPEPHS
ncbi:MAG: nitrate/nitrite transporter, partial [Halodesulfurarchaeum sp.]